MAAKSCWCLLVCLSWGCGGRTNDPTRSNTAAGADATGGINSLGGAAGALASDATGGINSVGGVAGTVGGAISTSGTNSTGGAAAAVGGADATGGFSSVGGATSSLGGAVTGAISSVGGAAGSNNCPASPVTFQIQPPPNANWCLGDPSLCGYGEEGIISPSGQLQLSPVCTADCDTCTVNFNNCHSIICIGPSELTSASYSYTWDGTYLASGTCGSTATSCQAPQCAAPGRYQLKTCGFPKPEPNSGFDCRTAPSSTQAVCTNFDFDYPATSTITVTLPVPVM